MLRVTLIFLFSLISYYAFSNSEPILLQESTIRLEFDQTEEMFYSFAEGDQIVIDFQMIKGKHLKEFEIIELPSNTVYSDYKVQKISEKKITVRKKGVYGFKFYSTSLTNRVFKISISRIPVSNETENFNTDWK